MHPALPDEQVQTHQIPTEPQHPAEASPAAGGSPASESQGRVWRELRRVFVRSRSEVRLTALDGARGIAVLFVIAYHTWLNRCGTYQHACAPDVTGEPISVSLVGLAIGHGDLGVDIFIVLSGYLIFSVLHRHLGAPLREAAPVIGRFLVRRFMRIYPALAVMVPLCMLFFYVIPGVDGGAGTLIAGCGAHAWSTYALVNNFPTLGGPLLDTPGVALACAPWTWSISVEWQLYLVTPLITWIYVGSRRRRAAAGLPVRWWSGGEFLGVILAVAVAYQVAAVIRLGLAAPGLEQALFDAYMEYLYANPLARCTPYLLGMGAAAYCAHRSETHERASAVAPSTRGVKVAVGVFVFFCVFGVLPFYPWVGFNVLLAGLGRTIFGAAIALVLVVATAPGPHESAVVRLLRHRIWYPIATLSYSAYLWQFAGIELARSLYTASGVVIYGSFVAWLGFAVLGVLATFVFALPSYMLIERPGMAIRPGSRPAPALGRG